MIPHVSVSLYECEMRMWKRWMNDIAFTKRQLPSTTVIYWILYAFEQSSGKIHTYDFLQNMYAEIRESSRWMALMQARLSVAIPMPDNDLQ